MAGALVLGILATGFFATLTLVGPPSVASGAAGGTIVGVAKTKEAPPKPVRVTIDPDVCGQTVPDESVVVDSARNLGNVVITVAGVKSQQLAEASFTNDKCRFVPHVAFLRPNGAVKMTSRDNTLHTMHAAGNDGRAFFNISLPV